MRRVSDDARLLALYLLTGQHTNMIGCFRLPDGYVSEDLAWTPERVSKGFDELSANGFATRDSSSKWVLIRNFLTWNSVENPNQGIAALRLFDQVPDKSTVKPELARVLASAISHIGIAKLKGPKGFSNRSLTRNRSRNRIRRKIVRGMAPPHPLTIRIRTKAINLNLKKYTRMSSSRSGRFIPSGQGVTANPMPSKPGMPESGMEPLRRKSSQEWCVTRLSLKPRESSTRST